MPLTSIVHFYILDGSVHNSDRTVNKKISHSRLHSNFNYSEFLSPARLIRVISFGFAISVFQNIAIAQYQCIRL